MDAVKVREQYQQALHLLSNLQHNPATFGRALSKLFLLIRLCYSIQRSASTLNDKDSNSIWQQRAATLHRDLTTATAQFLQSADQSGEQFWDRCLQLLYAGAEENEQIEIEKRGLVTQLAAKTERCAWLEQNLQSEHQKLEMAEKESTELRSKIAIQQQIIDRLEKNYREVHERLDLTIKEKHGISAEKRSLAEEATRNQQILERQAHTIQQLMEQCESFTREKNEALESLSSMSKDNHTLRVNLGQHGQVIENLININAEMMDAANSYALQLEQKKALDNQQLEKASTMTVVDMDNESSERPLDGVDSEIIPSTSPQIQGNQASLEKSQDSQASVHSFQVDQASVDMSQDKQATLEMNHEKRVLAEETEAPSKLLGPSPDVFSRIKGRGPSYDSLHSLSIAEQLQPFKDTCKQPVHSGDEVCNIGEGNRETVSWTSDLTRGSSSLDNLRGLEDKVILKNWSSSLENFNDIKSSHLPTSSSGLFAKLGGMGGRLQGVGGKAKGFLNFVSGADLAPPTSP